jgi:uncharacterized protein (DUF2249 family)
MAGNSTAPSAHRHVALEGLDYYARRRRLFTALRGLAPGQQMELSSDRVEDVYWLRYEMEARMPQRYCWSAPLEGSDTARVVVGLPSQQRARRDLGTLGDR